MFSLFLVSGASADRSDFAVSERENDVKNPAFRSRSNDTKTLLVDRGAYLDAKRHGLSQSEDFFRLPR